MRSIFYNISLYDLASIATFFSGLTLALLLAFVKRVDRKANLFLSLAIIVMVLKVGGLTQFLLPAIGPLLFFYVRNLALPDKRFSRKDILHFFPLLFVLLMPGWLISILAVFYLYLSYRLIQQFYRRLQPILMDRPRFAFRRLEKALFLLTFVCVLSLFNDSFYLVIALVLIGMAVEAMLKPGIAAQLSTPIKDNANAREKGRRLTEVMAANRFYEDPELTLATLAVKLRMAPHDLSRIINEGLEKNFNDFINEFRVREIAWKMADPDSDRLTLLGIAYESGFNSKTTFNRVFKEMTGKSPTEYKKHLENKRPSYNMGRYGGPELLILNREPLKRWVPEKSNSQFMFRNYVKIAWRNLVKGKAYSVINITGLATGIAVAMLIGLWIWDEVTFDKSFANHKQLAQIMTTTTGDDGTMSTDPRVCLPIAGELRSKYASDFKHVSLSRWTMSSFTVGDKTISSIGLWAEDKFPTMLSLDMLKGNINALTDPSSIIISASLAKTLFGNIEVIGKTIKLDDKDSYKVAGVFREFPNNNPVINPSVYPNLQDASYFLPWKKYLSNEQWVNDAASDWYGRSWQCYVQLSDNVDMDREAEKIKDIVRAHHNAKTDAVESTYLYPMDKWHLYSEFKNGKPVSGAIQSVKLFSIVGIFVLLLACINFMNLSTARSEKRAKEVGIRKTVGSVRTQLIRQFLSESLLVAFVSFIVSIVLALVLLPLFNSLAAKNMHLPWTSPVFWICALAFTFFTGLLSGSYPAFYLSKFDPIKVLKGSFRVGRYAALPRKVLVVLQFTFSIALIIGTLIVFKQIQFARNRPINYKHEGLITVGGVTQGLPNFYDAVRNDLLVTGVVDNMAGSSDGTTSLGAWRSGFNWEGKNPNTQPNFGFMLMTEDFGKTIGWQLVKGRDFSRDFGTDSLAMILNEAAVKQIGMQKDIVGENIQYDGKNYRVIGVVKDIIQESPYKPVTPMVYLVNHEWIGIVTVAIKTGVPIKDALGKIEAAFKKYNPNLPFEYRFNDEDYAKKFADELRIGKLATLFTVLAIFISCLGLFGLASFTAEQRKKEIGVRKVLGASTYNLWQMLSREFAWLVIISCIIAIPLAWYYSANWLQQYDYRTSMPIWIFFASGFGALLITILTVSFQSIKAALANPVKSLRTE